MPTSDRETCLWLLGNFLSHAHRGKVAAKGTGAWLFFFVLPLPSQPSRQGMHVCSEDVYLHHTAVHWLCAITIVKELIWKQKNTRNTRIRSDLNSATSRRWFFVPPLCWFPKLLSLKHKQLKTHTGLSTHIARAVLKSFGYQPRPSLNRCSECSRTGNIASICVNIVY